MKRISIHILAAVIPFILWTCKDDDSPSQPKHQYYLKMKVDGSLKEYDTCWLYGYSQPAPFETNHINILAGRPGDYGGAAVNDTKAIGVGTYLHTMINPEINIPMAGIGAYRAPGSSDIYLSHQAGWPLYEATVTFTTFDSDVASGTFSGQIRQVGGDVVLTITEGEFRAYIP